MSTLYRTKVLQRSGLPLYPFTPYAVEEWGELRHKPAHGCTEMWVDPGQGHILIPYQGGPRWCRSRAAGIKAAIVELEAAATSVAVLLDELRQGLLQASAQGE